MVNQGPSPKRRRTDNGPVTAQGMAQSNATLHYFMGNRQNRWVTDAVAFPSATEAESAMQANARAAARNNRGNMQPAADEPRQGAVSWAGVERAVTGGRSEALVDYESPSVALSNGNAHPANPMAQANRRSLSAQAGTATSRQGLPSPAPSDGDHINSPILVDGSAAIAAHAKRGPGRPPSILYFPGPAASGSGSPIAQHPRQASAMQRQHSAFQPPPPPRRTISNSRPAMQGSPQLHMQGSMQVVPPNAQYHPYSGQMSPSQGTPNPPAPQGQAAVFIPSGPQAQLPHGSEHDLAPYFNMALGLRKVDAQLHQLSKHDPTGTLFRNEQGRLNLLRQAVATGDYFYIVLSQLFCLRTTAPSSVPLAVKNLQEESWTQLEQLLCANSALIPRNVAWFAEFPAPIMAIYSSDQSLKNAYESQVQAVCTFLGQLPQCWQDLVKTSSARKAPPLVHDLVEMLSLRSGVLQTTSFRAIARGYYLGTGSPRIENGIEALVRLHYEDQLQYRWGVRRNPAQKRMAYGAYAAVYESWKNHDKAISQHLAANGLRDLPGLAPFVVPPEAVAVFTTIPGIGRGQQQQQHLQSQPPEQQVQFVAGGRYMSPLQQAPTLPSNALALAQQQAWAGARMTATSQSPADLNSPVPPEKRFFATEKDCPRPQPTHPDSVRSALHLAHLRSPKLVAAQSAKHRLYRHVEACALSPTRILDRPTQLIPFMMSADCRDTLPQAEQTSIGVPPTETLTEASHQYRLRCCRINSETGFPNISSWLESDNVWPDAAYFDFNDQPLEPRRKLHHGRYLPIDLTHKIRPGRNEVRVTLNRLHEDLSPFDYAVAVERVDVKSRRTIIEQMPTVSAAESLESIKQSLAGPRNGDDDIMMVSSSATIKLFDPISGSKIFDSPVRGEGCLHRDPFNLDTFLSTREPRGGEEGVPSAVDTWKCPICRKDARPSVLVRDGFLVDVRRELEARGGWLLEGEGGREHRCEERESREGGEGEGDFSGAEGEKAGADCD
ncbi:hypothetical protein LTR53_007297 [Teratosphaeriaceae sp. CCFEE 6253]|nr:hypothetical protein LTR53_007297 [Teratosphaeriaceae sp. CCFEE 6253]